MQLRDYLESKRITVTEFSRLVEYSRGFISGVLNGKLKIRQSTARRIARYTNGCVSEHEILSLYKEPEEMEKD